jgi:hypothetical protein
MAFPETIVSASDHIKSVAQKAAAVDRIEAELELQKANLKAAKADFNLSVRGMQNYAQEQLAFDLK